jgi:hypothetical protein
VQRGVQPIEEINAALAIDQQRWRVLQNWRVVISRIEDGPHARVAAREDAARRLGVTRLEVEAKRELDHVPPGDPNRKAMEALLGPL